MYMDTLKSSVLSLTRKPGPLAKKIRNILVLAFSFLPLLRALQSSQALISRHVAACDIGGTGVYRRRTPDRGSSRGTSRRGYHPGLEILLCRALQNVNPGMDAIIDKQNILRRQPVCAVFVLVPGNDSPCLKQNRSNAASHSWLLLRRILLYACLASSAGAAEAMELLSSTLTCGLHITGMNTHTAVR